VLWGVGNHGGGPSRVDLDRIAEYTSTSNERDVLHSTPEEYFADLNGRRNDLSRHADDLNPWGVGCYTSMIQIKQKHRQLEAAVFMLEKMASSACLQGLMEYPAQDVKEALKDLATAQFHDILPGSSIQAVEHAALRLLDHGLEICSRRKAQAFFALCTGQPKPEEGKIPIMVYNPHPYPLKGIWACEFQMPDMNWEDEFTIPHVFQNGKLLPCQPEKERSNFSADWRKRVVFEAELQPNQVTRFDCDLEVHPKRPQPNIKPENGSIRVQGDRLDVVVNCATGLLDKFAVDGVDMLHTNALRPLVMQDNEDPWGMLVKSYRDLEGGFSLMPEEEAAKFCAVRAEKIDAVRVIEDGPVRTVIEAALHYHNSAILQTYRIPKHGAEMEVEVRVHWNEKDRMLKWSVPTLLQQPQFLTQQAFGEEEQLTDGSEVCGLDWVALVTDEQALTVINDGIYGFDSADAELRLSLLRSPAYCGHPIFDRPIVQQDRYTPRIDQGERLFRFWISAGHRAERMRTIDRDALVHNEEPFTLSFFPSGEGEMPQPQLILEDDSVQLSAFKRAESLVDGDEAYVFRLFEPSGNGGGTTLRLPNFNIEQKVVLDPFEVKTFRFVPAKRVLEEVNIIEEPLET
jgi:alpha-mannosidase